MADQATQAMRIAAPHEDIFAVLTDFERYPAWARDLKEVDVVARDEDGRPSQVRYRAAAMGRSTAYTLAYTYSDDDLELAWRLVEGDIMRQLNGAYEFDPDGDETLVTYHLSVDLIIPLPGFVKRRAESRIINTALRELRDHVQTR